MNVNRKNINCSIAESVKRFKEVTDECRKRSIPVRAYALLIGFSVSHILSSVDHCAQIRVVHRGLPVWGSGGPWACRRSGARLFRTRLLRDLPGRHDRRRLPGADRTRSESCHRPSDRTRAARASRAPLPRHTLARSREHHARLRGAWGARF